MAVFFDIEYLPKFTNPVITIGTFDGVHKGHLALLEQVVDEANKVNGESILITFEPHPRKIVFPQQQLKLITTLQEKIKLVNKAGIKHIAVVPFTIEFAHNTAIEYIKDFLVGKFHPYSIVIGHDHQFGHDRKGNVTLLQQYATQFNYHLIAAEATKIDQIIISSTKVRHAIEEGDMEMVDHMLGRYFVLNGKVVEGKQIGRTIGYPTANISIEETSQILPAKGVYAVKVTHKHNVYNGMLNIGTNPTVTDTSDIKIETHLFNFSENIYGEFLQIAFIKKLRNEVKFPNFEALVAQLDIDKEDSLNIFSLMENSYLQL